MQMSILYILIIAINITDTYVSSFFFADLVIVKNTRQITEKNSKETKRDFIN